MHNSLMQIKLFNKWNHQKVFKDKPKTGSKTWKISRKVWVFGVKSAKSLPHFPQFSPWGERMGNGEFENQYSPIFPMMGNIGDPPYSQVVSSLLASTDSWCVPCDLETFWPPASPLNFGKLSSYPKVNLFSRCRMANNDAPLIKWSALFKHVSTF